MRSLWGATLMIALALAVPIVPLLLVGATFDWQVESWLDRDLAPSARFMLIAAVLAADIVLPVPSSAVSTYGGGILGVWPATAASWLGMTGGAAAGFLLARWFGRRFAARWASADDLERMAAVSERFGPAALVLTRPLPILAEACVLLLGANRLAWHRFLIPLAVANLVISLTYAVFGRHFSDRDALPAAVVVSALLPLGAALLVRRWLPRQPPTEPDPPGTG